MLRSVTLPASLDRLLLLFQACFTAPTFVTFTAMATGMIAQTGRRTVCGMLTGAGLAGTWHHARAHRFFATARWQTDQLGLALAEIVIQRLLPPGAPVLIAIDDTLFRRTGRKVHGTAWHPDSAANSRKKTVAWGNNWIVVAIVVQLPFRTRPIGLPVLARLWTKGGPAKPVIGRSMIEQIVARHPHHRFHITADAYYGTRHWRGLGRNGQDATLTVRLRTNAALTEIHTPPQGRPLTGRPGSGLPGRPKLRGDKIGRPDILAAREQWRTATITRYGRTDTAELIDYRCLWTGPLLSRHVRVILVRDTTTPRDDGRPYGLALLTTDLDSTAEQIIARYAGRWTIEVDFQDGKDLTGTGQARNRTRAAVERTVPFGLFTQSLVIVWYALTGYDPDDVNARRRAAPWYNLKTEPSYQDMLTKLRRTIIAARFIPDIPRPATDQEILAVHLAWADAAA